MGSDITSGILCSDKEVRSLIAIWDESNIQEELDGAVRNKVVYQERSRKLQQQGYHRDWEQCKNCARLQWSNGESQEDVTFAKKKLDCLGHRPVSVLPAVLDTGNSRSM